MNDSVAGYDIRLLHPGAFPHIIVVGHHLDDPILKTWVATRSPPAVLCSCQVIPLENKLPGRACLSRTAVSASLSASRPCRASEGILAKASLVGAKIVRSVFLRVSTIPAAVAAVTSVENLSSAIRVSTRSFSGMG